MYVLILSSVASTLIGHSLSFCLSYRVEVAADFTDDVKKRTSLEKRHSPDASAPIYGELVVLG